MKEAVWRAINLLPVSSLILLFVSPFRFLKDFTPQFSVLYVQLTLPAPHRITDLMLPLWNQSYVFSELLLWTWDHCFFSYNSHLQYSSHYFHTHLLPQLLFQHSWERTEGNTRVNFIFILALKCIINLQLRGCWCFAYILDHAIVRELFSWYHRELHPGATQETVTTKKLTVNNSGCST